MSLISKVFSKKKVSERPLLEHPKDLQLGDLIKFRFLPQQDVSNQRFEITEVNTVDFKQQVYTVFTLQGVNNTQLSGCYVNEEGEEYFSLSKKLTRAMVKSLFDEVAFAAVFEEGCTELERQAIPKGLEQWTASHYTETKDCNKAYVHKGDYRGKDLPQYEDESTAIDYYLLEDDDEDFAIEIEVTDDGETDVYATVYLEISAIEELWPAVDNE